MSEKAPGFADYTPSRLEWLVVLLNSFVPYLNTESGERIKFAYIPGEDGKTVILRIVHHSDLSPENLKTFEEDAKVFALSIAQNYKWDSWLEIKTQWDPIEGPAKQ